MLKVVVVEQPATLLPALAVGVATLVTVVVLKVAIAVLQPAPDDKFVIVTVVVPALSEVVVKVPFPETPPVKTIVAVFPVAVVEPDKL